MKNLIKLAILLLIMLVVSSCSCKHEPRVSDVEKVLGGK